MQSENFKWNFSQDLSDHYRFSVISTFVAFILGLYWYTIPIAAEHIYFFVSAPMATFYPCLLMWRKTFKTKNDSRIRNVFALAFFLTLITHYLNFVILGIGQLIINWFWQTEPPESIIETITYTTWLRMLISLYYFGFITFILFLIIGIYTIKTSKIEKEETV